MKRSTAIRRIAYWQGGYRMPATAIIEFSAFPDSAISFLLHQDDTHLLFEDGDRIKL